MSPIPPDANFLNLPTQWSLLKRAIAGNRSDSTKQNAWSQLLQYYLPAVRAYLMGCTHDADRTDDLVQKFSLQFLNGGYKHAEQEKGPFRHYLKRSLSNMVRQEGARREQFEELADPIHPHTPESREDAEFLAEYVNTLLDLAWSTLRSEQVSTGTPYYDFLKCSADNPSWTSEELAAEASTNQLEKYSAERFRKILSRARHKFATRVYQQVADGLADPTPDAVAEELADLKLLSYCSTVVKQQQRATVGLSPID